MVDCKNKCFTFELINYGGTLVLSILNNKSTKYNILRMFLYFILSYDLIVFTADHNIVI